MASSASPQMFLQFSSVIVWTVINLIETEKIESGLHVNFLRW